MIDDFITHLTTELVIVDGYQTVQHSWNIQPFDLPENLDLPAAAAYFPSEDSLESSADNLVKQRNTRQLWVFTICDWRELEDLRSKLMSAALGWQYTEAWDALQHVRGETQKISGNKIWWLDIFTTWHTLSQQ